MRATMQATPARRADTLHSTSGRVARTGADASFTSDAGTARAPSALFDALRMLRTLGVATAVGASVLASPVHAQDAAAPLNVSVAAGPALPLGKAAERWVALLSEDAALGRPAKLHPGASLSGRDPARELEALKDGKADLAVASALQWSRQVPAVGVFSLPWIAPEDRALEALAADASLRGLLAARLAANGVVLVDVAPLGYRELATMAKPIRAPADLAGLRVRASTHPLVQELLLALGALPQAMPFAEAQAAFASGALDGQEGSPTALAMARAVATGQRHLTDWGALADAMLFVVRKPVWDGWSEAQRTAVRRHAAQAIAETGALAREHDAMQLLARRGIAAVRITPAGHDAFREAASEVRRRWRDTVGADVVEVAERVVAQAQATPSRPQ